MMKQLFSICVSCAIVGCTPPAPPPAKVSPPPQVELCLIPEFEAEFDRLFLSQEPLRYQDNVEFLSSTQKAKLNSKETELVRTKLRAFLSTTPKPRPYATDSDHTGISSEISFLRLQSVRVLAEIGTKDDADFIRSLDAKAEGEHPTFDEECEKAIKKLETR